MLGFFEQTWGGLYVLLMPFKTLVTNRKARHNYTILTSYEAGLVLRGDEVKSLRKAQANIQGAYVMEQGGELFLAQLHITPYACTRLHESGKQGHPIKLLLKKREISKIIGAAGEPGASIIPLRLYLTPRGVIKAEIALAKGKKKEDKREDLKQRSWQRRKQDLLKKQVRLS